MGTLFFSKPKAGYFAMRVNHHGEIRYVSSMFSTTEDIPPVGINIQLENTTVQLPPPIQSKPKFIYIILFGFIAIMLFPLVPYFILRKVTTPGENLMQWAKQLNNENLIKPIPDFHYSELNSLAKMMKMSLQSVQETLEREKRFLGYASHELRTPIAVARTNSELLRKMINKNINVTKQEQVVTRIERACLTMTDLTETLLWLNREPTKSLPVNSLII